MKETYTEFNLLRFIYGECDIFQKLEIEDALKNDLGLKKDFSKLYNAYKEFPKVKFSPSNKTLDYLLGYSKKVVA